MSVEQTNAICCGSKPPGVAGAALVNACQLCPSSPTYWRDQAPTAPTAVQVAVAPAAAPRSPSGGLDWSAHKAGDRRPCRLCGNPAFTRDANGRPCHKTCAEQAGEQQAASAGPALRLIEGGKR